MVPAKTSQMQGMLLALSPRAAHHVHSGNMRHRQRRQQQRLRAAVSATAVAAARGRRHPTTAVHNTGAVRGWHGWGCRGNCGSDRGGGNRGGGGGRGCGSRAALWRGAERCEEACVRGLGLDGTEQALQGAEVQLRVRLGRVQS